VFLVKTRTIVHQIVLPTLQHFGLPLALTIYMAVSKTYSSSASKQQCRNARIQATSSAVTVQSVHDVV
jgi:hypothetical protein